MHKTKRRRLGIVTPLVLACTLVAGFLSSLLGDPLTASATGTPQVTVNMPFSGKWAWNANVNPASSPPYWNDSTSSHPSVHHTPGNGDWGTDLYGNEGGLVKLNVTASSGVVSFTWRSMTTSCGESTGVNVFVDDVNVGWIYFAHLKDAVTSGAITNMMTIGKVHAWPNGCNPGTHVHVEMRNADNKACYIDKGNPGVLVSAGAGIGMLGSSNNVARQACSTSPASSADGSNFNGDVYGDLAVLHERTDGGVDAHILYGSMGTPLQTPDSHVRGLPGSSGWDWDLVRTASGDFNGDGFKDVALVHKNGSGGADVHILYGQANPFQYAETFVRSLPASSGWNWDLMKLEAGKYNGDGYGDLAILHKLPDGGIGVHVLFGSAGTPLQNAGTSMRVMPASSGWNWDLIKTASGGFNGDAYMDIALIHKTASGGADIHVLYGGGTPFQYAETFTRSLPASSGWNWDLMKAEAGNFNGDSFDDLTILHKRTDGGVDAHILYGGSGIPLQTPDTFARSLPGSSGWNWDLIKTASAGFNGDAYADVALIHKTANGGADIHILYGGATPFQHQNTFVRSLPTSSGWNWDWMKIES